MTDLIEISTSLMTSDLFKSLQDSGMNDKLAGGGNTYKRISLKGGKFRQIVGGDQVAVSKEDNMSLIIIDAAPIAKTYYAESYDSEKIAPPVCWSSDSKVPDAKVPDATRQSDKCSTCPMAIKGSGQGTSAACRFSQRLAVVLEGQLDEVYQLQLPAKSVFGAAEGTHMPMQAYGKLLNSKKIPAIAVYTSMYFDENSDTPKVFFKPVRPLAEPELRQVVALRDSDEVREALTMTVAETDAVPARKPAVEKAKPKPEPVVIEEPEEAVEEPVKVTRKKPVEPEADDDLAGLISDWDDD